jgi:hypothetical protein
MRKSHFLMNAEQCIPSQTLTSSHQPFALFTDIKYYLL